MSNSNNNSSSSSINLTAGTTMGPALTQWEKLIIEHGIRPLSPGGYIGCAMYLVIIGLMATAGNTTTLVMFARNKKLRVKPHNMLLINLALSDLGISIFGYPLTTSSCFARRYLWGMVGCKVQGFSTFMFAMADMYTLTVVSVYRWVAVCRPHYMHTLNYSVTMRVIAGTWVAAVLTTAPPLVGMSRYTFEPFGTSCTIDWDDTSPLSVFYVYLLIVIAYVLPVAIMSFCYYKVVIRSNQLMRTMRQAQSNALSLAEAETANNTLAENKVTWVSLAMVLIFVVVWSPYAFVCVWAIYDSNIPVWVNTLPTMVCKASCMLNPLIFYLTNPIFRDTFRATFLRSSKVKPWGITSRHEQTFKINKTKDGVFIGENCVTFHQADTTMF
ncbi:opsin-5-like [Babylonia areolata]|uniref:opsin-5-like n=1 Tax=Babylonia areolata TaxID=304850 RepID=UPI003FD611D4